MTAPIDAAGIVAALVKPLEWAEDKRGLWTSETIVGFYQVGFDDGWWADLYGHNVWDWKPDVDPRTFHGPEAGRIACWADYHARIAASLDLGKVLALVEAANNASETWRRHGGISMGQMDDIHAALAAFNRTAPAQHRHHGPGVAVHQKQYQKDSDHLSCTVYFAWMSAQIAASALVFIVVPMVAMNAVKSVSCIFTNCSDNTRPTSSMI